jgi:diguanylate cyclase (GGDEF)-like protein
MPTLLLLLLLVAVGAVALRGALRLRSLGREVASLRDWARVEGATMLRNRRAFVEDVELELSRAGRAGSPASLIVACFDSPEDADAADACGREFARAAGAVTRAVDVAYRIGAAEYALILPDTRARGALVAAARLEQAVAEGNAPCVLRLGLAEAGPGVDRHELFRNAYCALLAAGRDGRPTVLAYSPELERSGANADLTSLGEIRAANRLEG